MNKKDIHLVLIHGFLFNRTVFEKSREQLSHTYTVHLIDLPGYGKNANTKATSLNEIAHDILRQIGDAKNVIWVGWSLGSMVAYYLAKHFPEMTSGIITFAAIPKFIKNDDWPVGVSHGAFSTLKQTFSRQPKIALKRFIMLQNQNMHFTNSKNITKLLAYIETAPLEIILRDLELLEHTDLRSVVSALTIPQLNILADNDRLVPSSIDDELKRLSPQSHNVIIKNAGHAMLISHTDECLTIIENFINESIITQ